MADDRFYEYDESDDPYYATRQFLAPQYQRLPVEDIEALLESTFPGMSPEDAEGFFSDLGQALGKVGKEIQRRAPGIVSGAVQGATLGAGAGPLGIVGGLLGGAALGGATYRPQPGQSLPGGDAARPTGQALGGAPAGRSGTGGVVEQTGQALGGAVSGSGPASQQLLGMLAQPQTWQALMRPLLGAAGQQTVQVGGQSMTLGQILGALGHFVMKAAEEYEMAEAESEPTYLMDAQGQWLIDPNNLDERAVYTLNRLYAANEALFTDEDYEDYEDVEDYEDIEAMEFDESFYEMLADYEDDEDYEGDEDQDW